MEPAEVLQHFSTNLQVGLPVDQPDFISLLREHDIIFGEITERLKLQGKTRADRCSLIVDEIERSLHISREKFDKFLLLLQKYKHGMETLAQQMESKLKVKPANDLIDFHDHDFTSSHLGKVKQGRKIRKTKKRKPKRLQRSQKKQSNQSIFNRRVSLPDCVQSDIYLDFCKLNGKFHEEYMKREDTDIVSEILNELCKALFSCDVKFSSTSMKDLLCHLTFHLPFNNILNVDLLKCLAGHHQYIHLIESAREYENTYFSMTLNNLLSCNRRNIIITTKLTAEGKEISHQFESVRTKIFSLYSIYQFKDFTVKLSDKILHIDVGQLLPEILEKGSVCVEWLIPLQLANYTYHSACINTELFHELQLSYLEIGGYRIEPVTGSDGCPYKNPIQIFCEHYQLLIENMEPKSLLNSLRDKTQEVFLSDSELDSIQTAPIDFMKNVYIVEKVRHMETPHLFMLLDILQDTSGQQHISNSILNALKLAGFTRLEKDSPVLCSDKETTIVDMLDPQTCSFNYNDEELQSSLEKFKSKRKRLLSPTVNDKEYFAPSSILLKYLDLCDKLAQLLQSVHPRILVDAVSHFVAIDTYDTCVKQFSAEYIKQLRDCNNSGEVLMKLFPYSNWCDHSIMRELLEACNCPKGVQLLDEFDSRIDLMQPIADFPIFAPSSLIIPSDSSYYTVMAIKHKQEFSSLKLCHIGGIKTKMVQMCNLTKYSCLFLTVTKSNPAVVYWLIPRNLLSSVSNMVWNFADCLYESGISEVAIYPNFIVSTSKTSKAFPLEYFTFKIDDRIEGAVSKAKIRSYDEVVAMLKHALQQKDYYITKLKSIENVQGYFEKTLKKQQESEEEQSIYSTNVSGIQSIEIVESTDKVEDWIQQTYQLEPDTLVETNELEELEKNVLIEELQKNIDKQEVKINMYLEEISDKSSQIETLKGLEKINKKLSTQISELKVKKGKSVAVQTDLAEKETDVNKGSIKKLLKQNLDKAKKQHGTIPVRFLKLLFIGSTVTGKTSFINLLLKRQFNKFCHSTNIVHATHVVSTKDVESSEVVWNEFDSAFEIDYLHSMILPKLLAALQEPTPAMETKSSQISTERDTLSSELATPTHKYKSVIQKQSFIKQLFTKFFENPVKGSNLSSFDRITDATVPDSFTNQSEALNIITLLDSGGLPEYISLLPTLNIYPTVTFIVHNLSKALSEPVLVEYSQKGYVFSPYHLNYCNLDMIKYLMSFASNSMKRPTFNISQQVTISNSNICLVGTHVDKVSQQEVVEVESTLNALVNNTHCETLVWKNDKDKVLFSVDNTTAGDEESVANVIRNRIDTLAEEKETDELPITWILLVLEIQQTCFKKKTDYISFHDCVLLARETGLMSNKEEIKSVLLYHHQLGVLTYFDEVPSLCDYVIVGHQWWLDKLNSIICITFQEAFLIDHHAVKKLKHQGLLSKELLQHLEWKDDLKKEFFLSLLVHMRISAPVFTEKGGAENYFIPFMLPACSFQESSQVLYQYGHLQGENLFVNFQSGVLPRGMFCSLVVELLQYPPKGWQPYFSQKGVYHTFSNLIVFQIHEGYSLSLLDKVSYLEVQITHPVRDSIIPVHYEAYTYLVYALKDVCARLNFDYIRLQYGFTCQCGEGIENHIAVVIDPNPVSVHYAQCSINREYFIELTSSQLAWFVPVQNLSSKNNTMRSETNLVEADATSSNAHSEIFNERPDMFDLVKVVIPRIMWEWEYIAEALRYDLATIEGIKEKERENPKRCCREFFKDWLTTNNGAKAGPKTWSTLLDVLKEVDEISSDSIEDIIEKVKQL